MPTKDWQEGFPGITRRFAIEYTGVIRAHHRGRYSLRLVSDDGSKLYIDEKLIVDNDGGHTTAAAEGNVDLDDQSHTIRIQYFQGPRYELALQLFCTPPKGTERKFPNCDLAVEDPPRLLVRDLREQPAPSNRSLGEVTADQPFFIDLRLPDINAERVGNFAEIEFTVKETGQTTHLKLGSDNLPSGSTVVYTTPSPVTIEKGGEGAGKRTTSSVFASAVLGGWAPGNIRGLRVRDGGTVIITYKDATTSVSTELRVYVSKTHLALGICQDSLDNLAVLYGRVISSPDVTPDGRKALDSKLKAIANERRIVAYEPKESDTFFFADTTRLKVCQAYFGYVLADPKTWNQGDPRSSGAPVWAGPDLRFPAVSYEAWQESQIVGFAMADGEQMWKDIALKSLADLTIDLYQVYIGVALGDQIWISAVGTNPVTGARVDLTDRVLAGVSFASNALLGMALPKAINERISGRP